MPKHKEYTILLISRGVWDESLHFGPFCHNWWLSCPINKSNDIITLYPIRLHFKTLVILNEREFITEVVQFNTTFGSHPGYICKYNGVQSNICETAMVAISSVYQEIDENYCKVTIFYGPGICVSFIDQNPDLIWSKIGILQQFSGKQLFG